MEYPRTFQRHHTSTGSRIHTTLTMPYLWMGVLLALPITGIITAHADNDPDLRYWITNGSVHAVINDGTTLYLGGNFSLAGPNTGHGAELNVANGNRDVNGVMVTGPSGSGVYAAVHDGDKGWYVGGNFTLLREDPRGEVTSKPISSKKITRTNLAHIKNDKTVSRVFDASPNGAVRALAFSDSANRLYIGGAFTSIDGEAHLRVAAIDTTTGAPVASWSPAIADGEVLALVLSTNGNTLYVGGSFTTVNGTTGVRGIAALDTASGNLIPAWGGTTPAVGAGEQINAMDLFNNVLYAGGRFTTVGGKARNNIAALTASDGVATDSWNPGANGSVNALRVGNAGTFVYAGGAFTSLGGTGRARLGRLRIDNGALDTPWAPTIEDGEVRCIEARDQDSVPHVFVGGTFTRANGAEARGILTLTASGQTNWVSHTDAAVASLAISSDTIRVFAGGDFHTAGAQLRRNVAAFATARGDLTAWTPEVTGGEVLAFAISSDKKNLYLGGDFTTVAGTNQARLARVQSDTGALVPWRPNIESGAVTTLALASKGKNITRLAFTSTAIFAGMQTGLYRSEDAGANWIRVSADIGDFSINDIAIDPNSPQTVYVATGGAGFFKSTDGGTHWSAINARISNLNANTIAVASDSTTLYAGTDAQTQTDGGFYRSDDGGITWSTLANGSVQTLAIHPRRPEIVFVGNSAGLFRSNDKGVSFVAEGAGLTNIHRVLLAVKPGTEETNGYVLSGSTLHYDYGLDGHWRQYEKLSVVPNDLAVNPNDENQVYVSSLGNGVYALEATTSTAPISTDPNSATEKVANVASWQQRLSGLTNTQTFTVALDPNNPNRLATGTSLGYVYLSTDAGQTWLERHRGIPTDVLYAGGTFSGSHPDFLAALDTSIESTSYFLDWNPNSSARVESLRLADKDKVLYAGGEFTVIGGQARRRIAALDTATALATAWAPDVNDGVVRAIALDTRERTLYLGGTFTNVGNITRNRLAALRTSDGSVMDWNPAADNDVTGLTVANEDNLVFVAGRFAAVGGQTRARLASLLTTANTNNATSWSPNADVDFTRNSIAADNNAIYIGGSFTRVGDIGARSFAGYTFAAPAMSITPLPQAYPDNQTISLSCREAGGQSCTGKSYYTTDRDVDNATWQTYSGPIVITESTQFSYYGETAEGIRSKTATSKYTIDRQRPTLRVDIPSGTYAFTQTVALQCDDGQTNDLSVSSCGEMFYTEDGSTPAFTIQPDQNTGLLGFSAPAGSPTKRYIGPIPVRIDLTLRFIAVDKAGNASEQGIAHYRIVRGEESAGYTPLGSLVALLFAALRGLRRRDIASSLAA